MIHDGRTWLNEDDQPGGGGHYMVEVAPTTDGPYSGICARCLRDRDDLFWHEQERTYYCVDVIRCEYRYYLQGERR